MERDCSNPACESYNELTFKTVCQLRITFNAAISACGKGLESELGPKPALHKTLHIEPQTPTVLESKTLNPSPTVLQP